MQSNLGGLVGGLSSKSLGEGSQALPKGQETSGPQSMDEQTMQPRTTAEFLAQAKAEATAKRMEQSQIEAQNRKAVLEEQKARLEMQKAWMEIQGKKNDNETIKAQMNLAKSQSKDGGAGSTLKFLHNRLKNNGSRLKAIKPMTSTEVMAKFSNAGHTTPQAAGQSGNVGWGDLLGFDFKNLPQIAGNALYSWAVDTKASPLPDGPITRPTAASRFMRQYTGPPRQFVKEQPGLIPSLIQSFMKGKEGQQEAQNLIVNQAASSIKS